MEGEIARDLVQPLSTPAARAWSEYQAGETREARFVALCDRLQLGVRWVGYRREGRSGLEEFRKGLAELDCEGFPPARALLEQQDRCERQRQTFCSFHVFAPLKGRVGLAHPGLVNG